MSVTRAYQPIPEPQPHRIYLRWVGLVMLIALWCVLLSLDLHARVIDEPATSTPNACVATEKNTCTVQTTIGPVDISVGYGGFVWVSTPTPTPKRGG
jgi:hypothetical protein